MSEFRERLLARARSLQDLALERGEEMILRAAVWLELRPHAHACRSTAETIAVHYLLLAEHPDVIAQPGLAARYRRRAWLWADQAEHGALTLSGLLERAHADA